MSSLVSFIKFYKSKNITVKSSSNTFLKLGKVSKANSYEELTLMGVIQKDTLKPLPERLDEIEEAACRNKFKDEIYE